MTFLALGAASLLAAPMAIALAVTAFWWNLTRPGGMGARTVADPRPVPGLPARLRRVPGTHRRLSASHGAPDEHTVRAPVALSTSRTSW